MVISRPNGSSQLIFAKERLFSPSMEWMDIQKTTVDVFIEVTFLTMLLFVSMIANSLVYIIFIKKPKLITLSNRLVLNLSLCNSLCTLIVMPVILVSAVCRRWVFGDLLCQAVGLLINIIFGASTLTLVAITVDRYCAIVTPLRYKRLITRRRTTMMIVAVWVIALMSALPPLLGWNQYKFQMSMLTCMARWGSPVISDKLYTVAMAILFFMLPLAVILWAYNSIFKAAKLNCERVRRTILLPRTESVGNLSIHSDVTKGTKMMVLIRRWSSESAKSLWKREEWKAAVTSMLVVFTFILCWLPYFLVIIFDAIVNEHVINPHLESFAICMAMSSCALNPFVYVFRLTSMRAILGDLIHRNGEPPVIVTTHAIKNTNNEPVIVRQRSDLLQYHTIDKLLSSRVK